MKEFNVTDKAFIFNEGAIVPVTVTKKVTTDTVVENKPVSQVLYFIEDQRSPYEKPIYASPEDIVDAVSAQANAIVGVKTGKSSDKQK